MDKIGFHRLCLDGSDWTLSGYWPNAWRLGKSKELGQNSLPILPPCRGTVPGAVQLDLLNAGEIEDVNKGLNSRHAEWVEHWEWIYSKTLSVPENFKGKRVFLEFDGLDYSGAVAIDGQVAGYFEGTHMPRCFEITGYVEPGKQHRLSVAFDPPPSLPGQFAYTYAIEKYKPRFNYVWDWVARTVSIGIWGSVHLSAYSQNKLTGFSAVPTVVDSGIPGHPDGRLEISANTEGYRGNSSLRLVWRLRGDGVDLQGQNWVLGEFTRFEISIPQIRLWWPCGWGDQALYDLTVELFLDDTVLDKRNAAVGFKDAKWVMNPGGPTNARPSALVLNGKMIYLRGANWVPLSSYFGGVKEIDYKRTLALYRNMNVNLLRVWGGGILEKEEFYTACDEAGIMVWQEFPLSSGGCSDYPPTKGEVIDALSDIAASMVRRRCHHASHLLWDGGNELAQGYDGKPEGRDVPVDLDHPLIAEFAKVVEKWDPCKKFIPTSGHGPRAFGNDRDFGKGVHHDVHGFWGYLGPEAHYAYYNGDDALWRSEVGVPGATGISLIESNGGGCSPWPPTRDNRLWLHHGAWWIGWDLMNAMYGPWDQGDPAQLRKYLDCSRYLQAEGYRYILESCRRRAFTCSLNTIWMGHDCYWTTSNNSVIEYDGSCKPAYSYVQRSFDSLKVSLKYDRCYLIPGEEAKFSVWSLSDGNAEACDDSPGELTVRIKGADGRILLESSEPVAFYVNGATLLKQIDLTPQSDPYGLIFVELTLATGERISKDTYIFGQKKEAPFEALRRLGAAEIAICSVEKSGESLQVTLKNTGIIPAVMMDLVSGASPSWVRYNNCAVTLFPGETVQLEARSAISGEPLPSLSVTGLNLPQPIALPDNI